jgi:hypothetical protein
MVVSTILVLEVGSIFDKIIITIIDKAKVIVRINLILLVKKIINKVTKNK